MATSLESTSATAAIPAEHPTTAPTEPSTSEVTKPTTTTTTTTTNNEAAATPAPPAATSTAHTNGGQHGAATTTTLGSFSSDTTAIPSKDDTNPLDFQGDVQTNDKLPSVETLRKLESYTVLDESGKSHTFKSLYSGPNVARRVLIIFIRHFFCGMCQEYLRTLSAAIPPESLLQLPVSTSIAVVGCGSPKLISAYLRETGCPYPVYADNTQHLYRELGMIRTLNAGDRPAYMQNRNMAQTVLSGISQALRQVKSGLVLQMGDQKQVGGEFLFEPASQAVESPIATPQAELPPSTTHKHQEEPGLLGNDDGSCHERGEEKKITWCHRMRNTRDHVEIPELKDVLGLEPPQDEDGNNTDGAGSQRSGRHGDKWAKAARTRKGTGLSMASQMSRMSMDAKGQSHSPLATTT